jgi:hypothetical protein
MLRFDTHQGGINFAIGLHCIGLVSIYWQPEGRETPLNASCWLDARFLAPVTFTFSMHIIDLQKLVAATHTTDLGIT